MMDILKLMIRINSQGFTIIIIIIIIIITFIIPSNIFLGHVKLRTNYLQQKIVICLIFISF